MLLFWSHIFTHMHTRITVKLCFWYLKKHCYVQYAHLLSISSNENALEVFLRIVESGKCVCLCCTVTLRRQCECD